MRIEAADYVEAANERLAEANLLYEKTHYALALYVAGVAVESLLRAYIFIWSRDWKQHTILKRLKSSLRLEQQNGNNHDARAKSAAERVCP